MEVTRLRGVSRTVRGGDSNVGAQAGAKLTSSNQTAPWLSDDFR